MSNNSLSYADDSEKVYGAAGMSLAIVVSRADEMLCRVNVDAPDGQPMIDMVPEFYYVNDGSALAGAVFRHHLQCFRLSVAMALGNIMSRETVLHHKPLDMSKIRELLDIAVDCASEDLGLERDETESVFNDSLQLVHRAFSHPGISEAAEAIARRLADRRTMSRLELLEQLGSLGLI